MSKEVDRVDTSDAVQERRLLMTRLLITCLVLVGPSLLIVGLITYAIYRSEETHPWSHRSVARSAPCEIAAGAAELDA